MIRKDRLKDFITSYGIIVILILLGAFFSIKSPMFLTANNLLNILRQVSIVGISAVGMTMVLLTSGIDLSVGAIIGVSGVGAAKLMLMGVNPVLAFIIMLIVSGILGFINGFFINVLKIPPLIATLGSMTSLRGLAYIVTGGLPVFGFGRSFSVVGKGYLLGIPVPVIFMTVTFVIGIIFLSKTRYGRYIYGVGGNEEATRLSGVNIAKVKYIVYTISGMLSGMAGLILLGRINSGQPQAGLGYEMDIITASVLGGVSISGGEGRLVFVIFGVLLIGVLSNGMIMLNINDYVQQFIKGLVLILAVALDKYMSRSKI